MKVKTITVFVICLLSCYLVFGKPIRKEKKKDDDEETDQKKRDEGEYLRYLGQVVEILEEDEDFKKKLHNASEDDIRSGRIADHIDLMSHNVRTKLDELKRMEIENQRQLHRRNKDRLNGINERNFWNPIYDENPDTFETEDLKKLLQKHNSLLEEQDKKRKDDFHKYELEKEHKRREDMKKLTEEERKAKEKEFEEEKNKLRKHEKMHQPGSKAELEEVWKEEDGLDPESFDPKTFFKLHDKNGDGFLDAYELETFFLGDVDKAYNESDSHTDPRERQEELERMREHVMKQMDKDNDGLVSADEFMTSTNEPEFEKDEEWKPVIDRDQYSEDELSEYEKQLAAEEGNHDEDEGARHEPQQGEHHEQREQQHQEQQQQHNEEQQQHHEQQQQQHNDQQQQHHEQQQQQHEQQQQQHNEQQQQQHHEQQQQDEQQQQH